MAGSVNRVTAFFQKVDTKGFDPAACWPWTGTGKGNGYGHTSQGTAHRVAYELFVGPVPEGMDVCHRCDTRFCVNPDHLFVGTRADNMQDMKHKGRGAGGNRKHLKERTIQEVRRRLAAGTSARDVADDMDISYETVSAIQGGRSYVGIGEQSDFDRQSRAGS